MRKPALGGCALTYERAVCSLRRQLSKRKRGGHCAHPVWFTQRWLCLSAAAANLPLAEVAKRAGLSLPRVSQSQAEIEHGNLVKPLKGLVERYSYEVKA